MVPRRSGRLRFNRAFQHPPAARVQRGSRCAPTDARKPVRCRFTTSGLRERQCLDARSGFPCGLRGGGTTAAGGQRSGMATARPPGAHGQGSRSVHRAAQLSGVAQVPRRICVGFCLPRRAAGLGLGPGKPCLTRPFWSDHRPDYPRTAGPQILPLAIAYGSRSGPLRIQCLGWIDHHPGGFVRTQ